MNDVAKAVDEASPLKNVTYDSFRGAAAEFFQATQDRGALTFEQAENGNKTLAIMYLNSDPSWTEHEINSAVVILELATKRCFEVFARNMPLEPN